MEPKVHQRKEENKNRRQSVNYENLRIKGITEMEQNKGGTAARDEKKTKEQKVTKQLGRSALPLNYLMQQ